MSLSENELCLLLGNKKESLKMLDKFEAESSLINFIKLGWSSLEPGSPLVSNWGLLAICDHLEAVTRGDIKRLLINVPPGCTKSMSTNVYWPAWEWGPKNLPHHRFISFSHEQNLAMRDNVRSRSLILGEWFQNIWGDRISFKRDQNAKLYFENEQTGWRQACAAESLTGRRGDRIIADDPHTVKGAESEADREAMLQVFSETVPTRLNKQAESAIVVIMQRVHERDVSGLILSKEMGYEHLMLPMEFEKSRRCFSSVPPSYVKSNKELVFYNRKTYCWQRTEIENARSEYRYNVDPRQNDGDLLDPERFPRPAIEELKVAFRAWGGSYAEAGQLQQRPAPRGGGMFKKDDFEIIEEQPELQGLVIRGWDLAASSKKKSPYTVGVKMARDKQGRIIILDVFRRKGSPSSTELNILKVTKADGPKVYQDFPQDPGQAGKSQKLHLGRLLIGYRVFFSVESGNKEERAIPFAAQVENKNVFLLKGRWNDDFLNEASLFPNGEFKDQIDATSRAFDRLTAKKPKTVGSSPIEVKND